MKKLLPILLLCLMPILAFTQTISLDGETKALENVISSTVNMQGVSELHLSGEDPINGASINITGDDSWLFIHGERPSYVKARLSQITIDGAVAVDDVNVRVEQYERGAVLIPHDDDFAGATLYADANLSGESLDIKHHDIYKDASGLSSMNNAASSFVLRKGYMMTIAQQINGSGFSKNYVANSEDIIVNELPDALNNEVSFVRVVRWNWPTKKGLNSTYLGDTLNCGWYYVWSSGKQSTDDIEYAPMKWSGGNVSEANFITKKNITHQLAFNEPNGADQANMSVDVALREYPKLLASGLRAGSPAPTDGGLAWLYEFMEKADALNYRVDFVAVHWYKGCQTSKQFYNWLKRVHDTTGRPIWITEFNNGANWTADNCIPTYEQQATKLASFVEMFDTTSFIERYCLFNWGNAETRTLANLNDDKTINYLHPSGIVYRDQVSSFAYQEDAYYTSIPVELPAPTSITGTKGVNDTLHLTWYDNAYQEDGFSIERSFEGGPYTEIGTVDGEQDYQVTYDDVTREEYGEYSYRVRTKKGDSYSAYSDVVVATLDESTYKVVYVVHKESGKKVRANGMAVEMADASETGTDVQWLVTPSATEGYSHIDNMGEAKRFGNSSSGPVLILSKWDGPNTKWAIDDAGDDYFFLTNMASEKRLYTTSDDLSLSYVATSNSGDEVQWEFVPIDAASSLSGLETSNFSVSPSPCEHTLTIHGLEQEANVKVMSVSGQVILQVRTQKSVDVSQLEQGVYFLQVRDDQVLKFVKK